MTLLKRQEYRIPSDRMVDVDTDYLRYVVSESGVDLPKISKEMGYCREYLGNCIGDGRIYRDYLKMLAVMIGFPIKQALSKKKSRPKKKNKNND